MKKTLLFYISFLLISGTSLFAQNDTVYLVTNGVTYNQMPANFISLDTFNRKIDSSSFSNLLVGVSATATFSDTAGSAYNDYFIRYTVNELQGGNSGFLSVDTNGSQRSFTALSSVTGTFLDDTLEIGSGGIIVFVLSAAPANTALQIQGEIYHEQTVILVRPFATDTIYFNNSTSQVLPKSSYNPNAFTIDSVRFDTVYRYCVNNRFGSVASGFADTMPGNLSVYELIDFLNLLGKED